MHTYVTSLFDKPASFYQNSYGQFPFDTKEVWFYGAGKIAQILLPFFLKKGIHVKGIIDRDASKHQTNIYGSPVCGLHKISSIPATVPIIITSIDEHGILAILARHRRVKNIWSHLYFCTYYYNEFPNPYWNNSIACVFDNKGKIEKSAAIYTDRTSVQTLHHVLRYRMGLNAQDIRAVKRPQTDTYFDQEIITLTPQEYFIDGGAFTGDTLEQFIDKTHNKFKKISSFEPDAKTFSMLNKMLKEKGDKRIQGIHKGLSNKNATVSFTNDGTTGSRIQKNSISSVDVVTLDSFCSTLYPTFIKLDIEGHEQFALEGAKKIIGKAKPKLAICVYHTIADLWEIPLQIKRLNPTYTLFLRHYSDTTFDTICYAI